VNDSEGFMSSLQAAEPQRNKRMSFTYGTTPPLTATPDRGTGAFSPLSIEAPAMSTSPTANDEIPLVQPQRPKLLPCSKSLSCNSSLLPGPPHVKNIIAAELCERWRVVG
jgi:hypothetical protein